MSSRHSRLPLIAPSDISRLWTQHADRLYLIARAIGGDPEDCVQKAFIKLSMQEEMPNDPLAWLIQVTRNETLQSRRSSQRRRRHEQQASMDRWFQQTDRESTETLDASDVTEKLQQLDKQSREIVVLHLWGGMSFEQIAGITGCSRTSAHRKYQSGLAQLRKYFDVDSKTRQDQVIGND